MTCQRPLVLRLAYRYRCTLEARHPPSPVNQCVTAVGLVNEREKGR